MAKLLSHSSAPFGDSGAAAAAAAMADMSPMADDDSPTVIHKRELPEDTDGDALSPQKRPLNNNNDDVATVFLIDAGDVPNDADQDESAVEVDEVNQHHLFFLASFLPLSNRVCVGGKGHVVFNRLPVLFFSII